MKPKDDPSDNEITHVKETRGAPPLPPRPASVPPRPAAAPPRPGATPTIPRPPAVPGVSPPAPSVRPPPLPGSSPAAAPPSVRPPPAPATPVRAPPSVRPPPLPVRTTSEPPRPPPPPSLRPSGAPPPTDAAALLAELEHARRVLASKIADLRAFQTERETLLARIAERDATIKKLEASGGAEVPRLRTQVLDLESELSVAKREAQRVAQLDAEASALRAQARRLEALQSEQAARVAELEGALARESARASELEAALAAEHAKLLEREARVRKLEGEIEESLAWAPAPQDDLTRIKGIGPKFRDALAALGVRSYAQIAAWSDADVAEMAAKLRIQPARIARDGWVEAARALAAHGQRVG